MLIRKLVIYTLPIILILFFTATFYITQENIAESSISVTPANIRIGLVREVPQMQFSVQGYYILTNGYLGELITVAEPGQRYTVQRVNDRILLSGGGEQWGAFTGPLVLQKVLTEVSILSGDGAVNKKTSGAGLAVIDVSKTVSGMQTDLSGYTVLTAQDIVNLKVSDELHLVTLYHNGDNRRYRGDFDFRLDPVGVTAINTLPIEQYLYGVVPAEMPSGWPEEALKAQAIVARTYALYSLGQHSTYGFDMLATQMNQVYRGYDHETPNTSWAVRQTAGQILTYQDQPILAAFFSSSGGFTGNCEDIWKQPVPYLRAVEDIFDFNEKHYNWSVTMTPAQLAAQFTFREYPYSQVLNLEEIARDATGTRVKVMRITGLCPDGQFKQEYVQNADRVRFLIGLKSSMFTMSKEHDANGHLVSVTFNGDGWGHGVGMSQFGAKGKALQGYNHRDILHFYYTNVKLVPNFGG